MKRHSRKALPRFEPGISCLPDRRFNQLSTAPRFCLSLRKFRLLDDPATTWPILLVSLMSQIHLGRSSPNNHLPCGISAEQREANSGFNAGLICSRLKLFKSFVTCPSRAHESTELLTSLFKSTLSGSFSNITASSESAV